jgi:hypothetical protein
MKLEALRDWIAAPVAIQIATSDETGSPFCVRGFGVGLDGAVLRVGVIDAQARELLAVMSRTRRIAVNLTNPDTFLGRQLKGPLVAIEEPSPDATRTALAYFGEFVKALARQGLTPEQCQGMFHSSAARWLRMQPQAIFDQSPGATAGRPLA